MGFGGGSTSDIGDPRSGEAMYAGTGSTAGSAQRMGMDRDIVERYQAAMDNGGDDGGAVQQTATTMALMEQERRNQQAAQQQAQADTAIQSVQEMVDMRNAQRLADAVRQIERRQQQAQGFPRVGFLGSALGAMGDYSLRMQANKLAESGQPVFDDAGIYRGVISEGPFGRVYSGDPQFNPFASPPSEDDSGQDIPRAPVTAITPAEEPVAAAVDPQYIRPSGGFYPEQGLYYRRGLLDEPVPGLLDFTARNRAFRQGMATDASLYDMPYDLTGYTLL